MSNREIARQFLQMTATGEVAEAYSRYVADGFVHHNQHFKHDHQSLLDAMEESARTMPGKTIGNPPIFN